MRKMRDCESEEIVGDTSLKLRGFNSIRSMRESKAIEIRQYMQEFEVKGLVSNKPNRLISFLS